jgi:hypothetical protein
MFIRNWGESPVLTTIVTTAKDVTEVNFPAVTVCREGLNMEAVSAALELDFAAWEATATPPATQAQFMQEQFGLPPGLSVMDVITRCLLLLLLLLCPSQHDE